MRIQSNFVILFAGSLIGLSGCVPAEEAVRPRFEPREVIDLGTVVTEDLPERIWGKALLTQFAPLGLDRLNTFDVIEWELGEEADRFSGSNAYYELFNHGGPHVDAPRHVSLGGGLDSYPIEVFSGPVKVFDAREFPNGHTIPEEMFRGSVSAGDVVLVLTGYVPPRTDEATPEFSALTPAAAEYLASLPVKAYGTDALSVDPLGAAPIQAESATERAVPVHYAFLSRAIPIYEGLFNLDRLLDSPESDSMYFVGVPLNIQNGDGMLVRPVVFIY